jgi:membrane protease subunit (stomatin/prohibitin family)
MNHKDIKMGLFNNKNPNETAYQGGKKHWTDVIKNSSPGDLLIWRQPEEDFNTNSTLIVMPGEEAIFVNQGTIEQIFESGTYKLSTNNYPFISRLKNAFSGGISTFNSVVYFVVFSSKI